jgi:hypothetical protein
MSEIKQQKDSGASSSQLPPQSRPKLPLNVRIIIGIISIPSFVLFCMLVATAFAGDMDSISIFEIVYAIVGVVALYIALTGKRLF